MLMGGSVAISMKRTKLPPISQLIDQLNDVESDNQNESDVNSSAMSHGNVMGGQDSSASTQSYHYYIPPNGPLAGNAKFGSNMDAVASQHQQQQQQHQQHQQQKHIESLQNMGFNFTSPIIPNVNRPLFNLGIMPGAQHPNDSAYYVPTHGGPYSLSPQNSMGLSTSFGGYAPTVTTASTSAGSSMMKHSDENVQLVSASSMSPGTLVKQEDEHALYCNCQEPQLVAQPQAQTQQQHIPRPRNAFILFRQHWHRQIFNQEKEKINADTKGASSKLGSFRANSQASRDIGQRWRSLSDSERQYWLDLAKEEKECHKRKYPDYTYVPTRKSKRSAHSSRGTLESASFSSAGNLQKQQHCQTCNKPKNQNQNQSQSQNQNTDHTQNQS